MMMVVIVVCSSDFDLNLVPLFEEAPTSFPENLIAS